MEAIIILIIVVGLPVTLGIGYAAYERHLKFKERQLKAITHETAEKAAQYAAHGWRHASAFSSASLPTRELMSPTRSKSCATPR